MGTEHEHRIRSPTGVAQVKGIQGDERILELLVVALESVVISTHLLNQLLSLVTVSLIYNATVTPRAELEIGVVRWWGYLCPACAAVVMHAVVADSKICNHDELHLNTSSNAMTLERCAQPLPLMFCR